MSAFTRADAGQVVHMPFGLVKTSRLSSEMPSSKLGVTEPNRAWVEFSNQLYQRMRIGSKTGYGLLLLFSLLGFFMAGYVLSSHHGFLKQSEVTVNQSSTASLDAEPAPVPKGRIDHF